MLIDFNKMQGRSMPCMNNGTGEMSAKMFLDGDERIILCRIHRGGSIGLHTQESGDDINYSRAGARPSATGWRSCSKAAYATYAKRARRTPS